MNKQNTSCILTTPSDSDCQGHGLSKGNSNNPKIRSEFWTNDRDSGPHEIDLSTGLPKLPIELPPKEPSTSSSLRKAPKMSNDSARKSVTFDPSVKERPKSTAIRKTMSDPSGLWDFDDKKVPKRSHPGSLTYKKSKSMYLQLQIPKASPPTSLFRASPSILTDSDTPDIASRDQAGILDRGPSTDTGRETPILDDGGSPVSYDVMGRRPSFLYQDDNEASTSAQGLTSSTGIPEDTYVTPFAQILSTLHRVRAQYLELMGLPDNTKTVFTRAGWTPLPSPNLSASRKFGDGVERKDKVDGVDKKRSIEVLNELDWCVRQLESINSAKSVGDMAQEKFRRLLNRELSNMSEGSKRGALVADYVSNITNLDGLDVDRALSIIYKEQEDGTIENNLSASLSHDTWTKLRSQRGRKKVSASSTPTGVLSPSRTSTSASSPMEEMPEKNYCDRVPTYGFEDEKLDMKAMREFVDTELMDWNMDVFHFNTLSCGNPLVAASYIVFKKRKFFSEFQITPQVFINYMGAIQHLYHHENPYHNAIHATDVMLNANNLLNTSSLENIFTPVEEMAALVAAAIHDVDHPGLNNQYLVAVRHELAILYNDSAVLENHHLATGFKTFQKAGCNFLERFDTERMQVFRKMVIDMVLATDMAQHIKQLAEMKTLLETMKVANDGILVLNKYSDRSAVLQCLVHCADLSNPVKNERLATKWAERIIEENVLQGDKEKELGMIIHPMGDRTEVSVAKHQISFIDYIIFPLWETWADLVYPCGKHLVDSIHEIRDYWDNMSEPNSPPPQDKDEEEGGKPSDHDDKGDGDNDDDAPDDAPGGDAPGPPGGNAPDGDVPPGHDDPDDAPDDTLRVNAPGGAPSDSLHDAPNDSDVCASAVTLTSSCSTVDCGDPEIKQDSLTSSADSATLKIRFEDSPANERRTSFKTAKARAVVQELSVMQQGTD